MTQIHTDGHVLVPYVTSIVQISSTGDNMLTVRCTGNCCQCLVFRKQSHICGWRWTRGAPVVFIPLFYILHTTIAQSLGIISMHMQRVDETRTRIIPFMYDQDTVSEGVIIPLPLFARWMKVPYASNISTPCTGDIIERLQLPEVSKDVTPRWVNLSHNNDLVGAILDIPVYISKLFQKNFFWMKYRCSDQTISFSEKIESLEDSLKSIAWDAFCNSVDVIIQGRDTLVYEMFLENPFTNVKFFVPTEQAWALCKKYSLPVPERIMRDCGTLRQLVNSVLGRRRPLLPYSLQIETSQPHERKSVRVTPRSSWRREREVSPKKPSSPDDWRSKKTSVTTVATDSADRRFGGVQGDRVDWGQCLSLVADILSDSKGIAIFPATMESRNVLLGDFSFIAFVSGFLSYGKKAKLK